MNFKNLFKKLILFFFTIILCSAVIACFEDDSEDEGNLTFKINGVEKEFEYDYLALDDAGEFYTVSLVMAEDCDKWFFIKIPKSGIFVMKYSANQVQYAIDNYGFYFSYVGANGSVFTPDTETSNSYTDFTITITEWGGKGGRCSGSASGTLIQSSTDKTVAVEGSFSLEIK